MKILTYQLGDRPEDQHGRIEINMRARAIGKTARIAVYNEVLPKIKKAIENGDFEFTGKNSIRIYTIVEKMTLEPSLFETRIIEIKWG